jgi:hypothetical protein
MDPLVIQHHIGKTGGMSLRVVTRANYGPAERLEVDWAQVERWLGSRPRTWSEAVKAAGEYYESLPTERRARLRCIIGTAGPVFVAAVKDRPVRAFCMFRDPVERTLSLYRHGERLDERGADRNWAPIVRTIRERDWTLKDVYRELGGASELAPELQPFLHFFNGQARHVLTSVMDSSELPLNPDEETLEGYRRKAFDLLSDSYLVGTQDRFSQSMRLFAESFGWRRAFVPRVNVAPRSQETKFDEETRSLIRAYNGLDGDLHAHYSERLRSLPPVGPVRNLRGSAYHHARRAVRSARPARALGVVRARARRRAVEG